MDDGNQKRVRLVLAKPIYTAMLYVFKVKRKERTNCTTVLKKSKTTYIDRRVKAVRRAGFRAFYFFGVSISRSDSNISAIFDMPGIDLAALRNS